MRASFGLPKFALGQLNAWDGALPKTLRTATAAAAKALWDTREAEKPLVPQAKIAGHLRKNANTVLITPHHPQTLAGRCHQKLQASKSIFHNRPTAISDWRLHSVFAVSEWPLYAAAWLAAGRCDYFARAL
jgi:hypothetical protein